MFIYVIGGIASGLLVLFVSPFVIPVLLGPQQYISSIMPLQILSFVPLTVGISCIMGYETMLPLGMLSTYSHILIVASLYNLILIVPFIQNWEANGVALASFATESLITILMGGFLWKKKILIR